MKPSSRHKERVVPTTNTKRVDDGQSQESLIADTRAELTPADRVEQRLQALLGGSTPQADIPRLRLPRADGHTKKAIEHLPLEGENAGANRQATKPGRGESALYAISIEQARAAEILSGSRPMACRFWRTDHRGLLLIHARKGRPAKGVPASTLDPLRNAFVGVVRLVDCIASGHAGTDPDEVEYHWVLADPLVFTRPVPYAGRLGLFLVSEGVVAAALRKGGLTAGGPRPRTHLPIRGNDRPAPHLEVTS